jgi:glycosyltransferase involved in cell wall biosynthesis
MNDPMRVALIAPPWVPVPPTGYGGTEAVLDRLAAGLARAGHEVLLAAHPDSTCPVELVPGPRLPSGEQIGGVVPELAHVRRAYEVVAERGADVVHDHTMSGPFYAEKFPHLPLVTTNHGPFDDIVLPLYREMAERAAVVAISHSQASAAGDVRIARVIHHGVDVDQLPLGPGDGGYLLFLGRMAPTKGVHVAARVAQRAGLPLLIAAKMWEPAEREYFDISVRPLLGGGVDYIGEVGGAEKLELLGGALALLNPIAWPEPFGMVMVEALACGTPVITTPFGAAPEIVEHDVCGYVCGTEDDLVEAVARVASIERATCRAHVAARFSTERMVDAHVELYEAMRRIRPTDLAMASS